MQKHPQSPKSTPTSVSTNPKKMHDRKSKVVEAYIVDASGAAKHVGQADPAFKSLADEKKHLRFIKQDKRKEVLAKTFLHDSKLLAEHHYRNKEVFEIEILKTIQAMCQQHEQVLKIQNDLAMREDFDIILLFAHMDRSKKGVIGLKDFETGMARIGIFPHRSDICLLMKTYDLQTESKLDFSTFSCMIMPEDLEFKQLMLERIQRSQATQNPIDIHRTENGYLSTISKDTYHTLVRLFDKLLIMVVALEALKQRLQSKIGVDLSQSYKLLQKQNSTLLTTRDLEILYDSRNINIQHKELSNWIRWADKDRDGSLSFTDFVRSLTPIMSVEYN
jgi:Ca2+-binding EF-hand superfamily protein